MICQHFNLSYIQIRDDLTLWEYLPLLAIAADEEEIKPYNEAVTAAIAYHDPKRIKRWKFSSADKAGTRNTGGKGSVIAAMLQMAGEKMTTPSSNEERIHRAEEYALATHRTPAYQDREGRLLDKDGKVVEKTPLTLVIPLELPHQ